MKKVLYFTILLTTLCATLSACKDNGKESYIFAGNMADAVKWAKRGFDSVTYSLDASVFISAFRTLSDEFRSGLA